jgi:putative SOS response-associated peptidase YedK
MCGRYSMGVATERIVKRFDVTAILLDPTPGIDQVRPTNLIPVITQPDDRPRQIEEMRWGLIPSWSKEISGRPLINARAETLSEKPSFRNLLRRKRCLIPADGFYEWSDVKNSQGRQDMYWFGIGDREIFAFAGLYDEWRDPHSQKTLRSTCIVTCEPNKLVNAVHDRMPAILQPGDESAWLTRDYDTGLLPGLLQPYPIDRMRAELCLTDTIPRPKSSPTKSETPSLF